MKICFVGPADSAHIVKWCNWFSKHGHEVHVVSFTKGDIEGAEVHVIDNQIDAGGGDFQKIRYLMKGRQLRKTVEKINPDVVNVHYATSYGTAAALGRLQNYVLSVWGADIYDFPRKSFIHRIMLQYSLKRASCLFSTSQAMADEARKYTDKEFAITPFGVDTDLFNPSKRTRCEGEQRIILGTVKSLSDKYGIADILKATSLVVKHLTIPVELRIAGKGPQEKEYHRLAKKLDIDECIEWLGFISQEEAAKEWANMDIALIPSTLQSESFGVSAVEAQACGTAVIVSDIPGLMEATSPGETSLVVPHGNPESLADAIIQLCSNPERRHLLGVNGRQYVCSRYEMDHCFRRIESLLKARVNKSSGYQK